MEVKDLPKFAVPTNKITKQLKQPRGSISNGIGASTVVCQSLSSSRYSGTLNALYLSTLLAYEPDSFPAGGFSVDNI
jgi:hypothetical protein